MIKNTLNLTKIFLKDTLKNQYIIDQKTNKINKKSIFVLMIAIVTFIIAYLSFEIIKILVKINTPTIFLNVLFLVINIVMVFQIILSSMNTYFFSKDFNKILYLPLKPEEILISKFNVILASMYFSEIVFGILPLFFYGQLTNAGILYYFSSMIILLMFPILTNIIISILTMILVKLSRFIKNKDLFQIIVTFIAIFIIFILGFILIKNTVAAINNYQNIDSIEKIQELILNFEEKVKNINKYFLIINPSVDTINNYDNINSVLNLGKILIINIAFAILFIFIGKKYYLKNVLKNNNFSITKNKKIDIGKKLKKSSVMSSYIKKEFKTIFKTPIYFIQCIYPTLLLSVIISIIVIVAAPRIRTLLTSDYIKGTTEFSVNLGVICIVLALLQIIFTISSISISSISREGKNAICMKYLPIDFYKQFIYKSIPQKIVHLFLITIILILIKIIFPEFTILQLLFIFIIGNLLNIINSNIMLLVDLYKPNINWNEEYEAVKNGTTKIFQYAISVIIIILLKYFNSIFNELNLNYACALIIIILTILIFIINKIIKININKLFKNIK